MKKVLLLLVTAVIIFTGCSKDEELSKTELLCNADWTLNAWTVTYTYGGITNTVDIYNNPGLMGIPDCILDDYINFDIDKTYSTKPGINQCNGAWFGSGDWTFKANEAVLSITRYGEALPTDYNIVTLNEGAFSISTIQSIELIVGDKIVIEDGTFVLSFVH